jgi:hypothetical protein
MRSGRVETADKLSRDGFEVLVVEENYVIEGLAPQAADKSFTNGIHFRGPDRRFDHPHTPSWLLHSSVGIVWDHTALR